MKNSIKVFTMLLVIFSLLMVVACGIVGKSYEVSFLDYDGLLIQVESIKEGNDAISPSDPYRQGYTFIGWDKEFTNVSSELTITAIYEINSYIVTYKDYDDTILKTETVTYGSDSTPPDNPDNKEGYLFERWDKAFNDVRSNLEVKALYVEDDTIIENYTVYFRDYDGRDITSVIVEPGGDATPPDAPTREGYTFIGWSQDLTNININKIVTALYEINTYIVTFVDHDDEVLKVEEVDHGNDATPPANPNNKLGHHFTSWDNSYINVTGDINVKALYEESVYIVNFFDFDGSILKNIEVNYGEDVIAPDDPEREGYDFIGWDKDFTNISSSLDINALYEIKTFEVSFFNYDLELIKKETVNYGEDATAPDQSNLLTHIFIRWDVSYTNIKSNLSVLGVYERVSFTVTFVDYDASIIRKETVFYNEDADGPADRDDYPGHYFVGWDKLFNNITENITVTALYDPYKYNVSFYNYDETLIEVQEVFYGESATAPLEFKDKVGHHFKSWDKDFRFINEDLDVYPVFNKNLYKVTFVDYNNSFLSSTFVYYDEAATPPADPDNYYGHRFIGWNQDFSNVKEDMTVKALYEVIVLTVTFDNDGGTPMDPVTVYFGNTIGLDELPIKEGYTFNRWTDDSGIIFNLHTIVTRDYNLTAKWDPNFYTITWRHEDGSQLTKSFDVPHGEIPEYEGMIPQKHGYIFVGFTPEVVPATEDTTYYAVFVKEDPE